RMARVRPTRPRRLAFLLEIAMTEKRILVMFGVVVLEVVIGLLLYWQSVFTPFQIKYARVRPGMTVEEVHAILGKPNWASDTPPMHHGSIIVERRVAADSPEVSNWVLWKEEYSDPTRDQVGPASLVPPESRETAYVFFAHGRVTRKEYWPRDWDRPPVAEWLL